MLTAGRCRLSNAASILGVGLGAVGMGGWIERGEWEGLWLWLSVFGAGAMFAAHSVGSTLTDRCMRVRG